MLISRKEYIFIVTWLTRLFHLISSSTILNRHIIDFYDELLLFWILSVCEFRPGCMRVDEEFVGFAPATMTAPLLVLFSAPMT